MELTITVYGLPAPQGSKRFMGVRGGKGILVESSKAVKPWRQAVVNAAIEAMGGAGKGISGPIRASMVFTMPKPKSAPKTRRTFPQSKPDLSKLIRSTEDALTDAGAWEDDARVIRCVAAKVFPGEGTDSLAVPGAVIRLSRAEE
jgi:crossover junction endodeoxyribonuclease RusA